MSETIIVALITIVASLAGTIMGIYVSLRIDSKTAKRYLRKEKQICYTQFISTCTPLLTEEMVTISEMQNEEIHEKIKKLLAEFRAAYNSALLVCDDDCLFYFIDFDSRMTDFCKGNCSYSILNDAYWTLIREMRKDLEACGSCHP